MLARRLEALAVGVGALPTLAVFVTLLAAVGGLLAIARLEPGWPSALAVAFCNALAFGWIWSVGAVSDRALGGRLGTVSVVWAGLLAAAVVARAWLELADPVSVRGDVALIPLASAVAGVALLVVANIALPIWASVKLGAARPEPWSWIVCAGAAVLLVFSPIGVWYVQPWIRALLADPLPFSARPPPETA